MTCPFFDDTYTCGKPGGCTCVKESPVTTPDEQTVERVAKAIAKNAVNDETGWRNYTYAARAAITALPDTAAARWKSNAQSATGTLSVVRAMIGEMFGAIASIESEDATLLRGPEPKHDGEAILEALQRVQSALEAARKDALREAAEIARQGIPVVGPDGPSSPEHNAAYEYTGHVYTCILALIDKEPTP